MATRSVSIAVTVQLASEAEPPTLDDLREFVRLAEKAGMAGEATFAPYLSPVNEDWLGLEFYAHPSALLEEG